MNQPKLVWQPESYGFEPLPKTVVDSHKMPMDVSGGLWRFNTASGSASFDFDRLELSNPWLSYGLKRHLIFVVQRTSPREAYNIISHNALYLSKVKSWPALITANTLDEHERLLNSAMSETLEFLRGESIEYNFHRLRAWYIWGADFLPELGFDPEEAYKWQQVEVPGNEKGVAVRTSDPNGGPLNDAELIILRRALMSDLDMDPLSVQQRAAMWLALVFGRNPSNYILMRQGDFSKLDDDVDDLWVLKIPRIKKRTLPRTLFKQEYVEPSLAAVLHALIAHGPSSPVTEPKERPLFAGQSPRKHMVGTPMEPWAWHLNSSEFTLLIQAAVERYAIISPRTNEPLYLTTRRLRYTFATNRVREGISARELADALDHTDLQNVRVYFDAQSTVVERLDRAAAMEIAPKLNLFKGRTVKDAESASQGNDPTKRIRIIPELIDPNHHVRDLGACGKAEFCNLFPPYSCYPCDKFEPFRDSLDVHEMVFDFLVKRRERLRSDPLESSRIAVQLDEVIYACGQVILETRAHQDGVAQ